MNIQFASARPGIELFNSNMQHGDAERHAAEAERRANEDQAQRRTTFEQAQGADRATREGIGAYYAGRSSAAATPQPAAPTPQAPTEGLPSSGAPPAPARPPADMTQGASMANPVSLNAMPAPAPAPGAPVAASQPQPQPAVPAVNGAPTPAAAPMTPAPRPAVNGGAMDSMMGELAKAPGTGQTMMHLFSNDLTSQRAGAVEDRRLKAEGNKEMLAHLKDGDVKMAQAVAQQYGINIPPEVWQNRSLVMNLRLGANLAKTMGVKDDHAVHFVQGFVEGLAGGLPEDKAVLQGLKNVPAKDGFEAKHWDKKPNGEVVAFNAQGDSKDTGVIAHVPKEANTLGRPSATIQNRNDMAERLKKAYPGLDEGTVQKMVVNPRATVTTQDLLRVQDHMRKLTKLGQPVYKTEADVQAAARRAVDAARADAAAMAGEAAREPDAPGPAAPGPRAPAPAAAPNNDPLGLRTPK